MVGQRCGDAARVSALVFCYNHSAYVAGCLDSVVAAGGPGLEIVVIDDASTDGSVARINSWRAANPSVRLRLVVNPANFALPRNMNRAIAIAGGELLALVAADDRLLPHGIAARVEYMEAHPDLLGCFADCHVIDATGRRLFESGIEGLFRAAGMRKRWLTSPRLVARSVVFHWAVPGPVFMARRSALVALGGYDESVPFGEDWDMFLRLSARRGLGFVDRCVAEYRVHGASATFMRQRDIRASVAHVAAQRWADFKGLERIYLRLLARQARPRRGLARLAPGHLFRALLTRCLSLWAQADLAWHGSRRRTPWLAGVPPEAAGGEK
jgi:glycosyltransferase involved in cell wall biosynthesis